VKIAIPLAFIVSLQLFAQTSNTVIKVAGEVCSGKLETINLLKDINVTDADLLKGIPCSVGDLDGDKNQDYVFSGNRTEKQTIFFLSKVILMENGKIKKSFKIDDGPIQVYFPKDKSKYEYQKSMGCKLPDQVALLQIGEGDGLMNKFYVLNSDHSGIKLYSECMSMEIGE
jgi:hypothetical protein